MIRLAYASFGREPPSLRGRRRAAIWLVCAIFVVWGLAAAIVLNGFGLFVGTTIRFLGRNRVEYRFFRLFGVRAIVVAAPVLFSFFAWREVEAIGLWEALWPILAIPALAAALLALCAALGRRSARP